MRGGGSRREALRFSDSDVDLYTCERRREEGRIGEEESHAGVHFYNLVFGWPVGVLEPKLFRRAVPLGSAEMGSLPSSIICRKPLSGCSLGMNAVDNFQQRGIQSTDASPIGENVSTMFSWLPTKIVMGFLLSNIDLKE